MEERKKAKFAIILVRVSSKEQEDGYSLDAQKKRLEDYCIRLGLEVIKIFELVESSTVGERKKFMTAIKFAKQQKEIVAIVVDKVDRLQRSYNETPFLIELIKSEKIELHFNTENCIIHKYSTAHELMMWDMFVMFAKSYVNSLKDNINRAIAQKLRCGEWVTNAPIGYLHNTDKTKKGADRIYIDPERSPFIKKIFELYATGLHSLPEIWEMTKEWGLTNSKGNKSYLCREQIFQITKNTFYYGVMKVKKTGKEYPHIYPPIISKSLFDACQNVRLNWGRKSKGKYSEKEFIFRGLIRCSNTDKMVTPYTVKKTNKKGETREWTYLRAWELENPKKAIHIPEEKVLIKVEKVFKSMVLSPELRQEVISYIKTSADAEKDYHKRRLTELYAENTKIKTRMDRLMDYFLDGELSKEDHEAKRAELIQKREKTIKEIEAHNKADDSFAKMLISLVELASDAYGAFKSSTIAEKRRLVNLVFANLFLNGEKLDFKLRLPFDTFINIPKSSEWWVIVDSNHRPLRCQCNGSFYLTFCLFLINQFIPHNSLYVKGFFLLPILCFNFSRVAIICQYYFLLKKCFKK
ncbi:Cassette chromosome recombinase B [Rickettsia bellii OSU 85-389]|uniref:recombinase family protein n=1 Tax=Rickettsia bellii TaxID=33990 RepID=UPI0000DB0FC5|nr:recombinase family protein [Rickettsia bellii]ABV79430.1 Cassette chromosome recombinase B [Rickettsia bellii OSU 85-389]